MLPDPSKLWASAEVDARRSLSRNLGTESGESGSAPTVVAPTSVGADADHKPAAGAGHERRKALEVEAVEQTGTSRIRSIGDRLDHLILPHP